jgi:hypothetical protein
VKAKYTDKLSGEKQTLSKLATLLKMLQERQIERYALSK